MDQVPSSSAPPPGESHFGKYRLVRHIASGGMAQIYLASIDGPDGFSKTCVIKRILPEYARVESFSRMFADEAKVAALLTHPNIVQVFDFGKIDGQYYLAMEWIQGESLDRLGRHAKRMSMTLGPRIAVEVGLAVSGALAYAHEKTLPDGTPLQLVHRDITPGNVLVSREGIVKLGDFGIVKSSVNLDRTVAGVVKGKYAYMSPEQISNRPLDHRSDLYSLGIVLYEVATGTRLFKRETLEATILAASAAEVPPPSQHVPDFPPALEAIILRLLAKEPEGRYPSAHALHDDLEQFRATQGGSSGGRELAAMMAQLFPREVTGQRPALTSQGSHSATGQSGVRAPGHTSGLGAAYDTGSNPSVRIEEEEPSVPPPPQPVWTVESTQAATGVITSPVPPQPASTGFPWGIVAAVAVAGLGSALFWFLVS